MSIDDREEVTPGYKFNEWELKGVPIRIEIGPRDIENNKVILSRRDIDNSKEEVSIEKLKSTILNLDFKKQEHKIILEMFLIIL